MKKILLILLIINIIIFIILANFRFYIYNINYYDKEFSKLEIYEKYEKNSVLENTKQLISYFKSNSLLTTEFFNQKEKLHLIDVKNLINKTIILFYISLVFLIVLLLINKKELQKSFFYSGIFLILITTILSLFQFSPIFIKFHQIFFNNDLWLLNPETDNLINLFPEQFFIDFVKKIFINSSIVGLVLIIFGFLINTTKDL